jgi:lipopolysaccharide/colanic/teichoic acid biosynthesis glycosyltransferase
MAVCVVLLLSFPVKVFLVKNIAGLMKNWWTVLIGKKSWVGYARSSRGSGSYVLPKIRDGVLSPANVLKDKNVNESTRSRLNLLYAKEYSVYEDLAIVARGIKELGAQYPSFTSA